MDWRSAANLHRLLHPWPVLSAAVVFVAGLFEIEMAQLAIATTKCTGLLDKEKLKASPPQAQQLTFVTAVY